MASSSADCVFGPVRLISSTSSTSANNGPRRNTNSFFDVEHMGADDVAGHQIRRALHAFEFAAEHARQGLGQQGLAEAGPTLHQHVAARDQRDTQRADDVFGADDDAREFALQGLFEAATMVFMCGVVFREYRGGSAAARADLARRCASAYQDFS